VRLPWIRSGALAPVLVVLLAGAAQAQTTPGPPGPYVLDLRGAMLSVPATTDFYPTLPADTVVPGRGFGFDVGGHVLGPQVGGGRLGIGVNVVTVRASVGPPEVVARATTIAPQVSLNFGTADGWSFISAGVGTGQITTRVESDEGALTGGSGRVLVMNFGGGARWFVNPHLATGFDVRFHRFAASPDAGTPATMRLALSVGVSVR